MRGLFVAGDTASREPIAGAISGGGAQNSSWALSSGQWAGAAAARLARADGRRSAAAVQAIGQAGLRPRRPTGDVTPAEVVAAVQAETLPFDKAVFRTGEQLGQSVQVLETVWRDVRDHLGGRGRAALAAREAAAMTAGARWISAAAFRRTESRGLHRREDRPAEDARLARRLTVRGLDLLQVQYEEPAPAAGAAA
ncbi:MAG: FAD-binding protein [Caulobacteraceae bacterium]